MAFATQTVITRAGNPADSSIVTVPLGDNGLLDNIIAESVDILSRSTDNPLGLNGLFSAQTCNLKWYFELIEAASGYDIHGQPVNGVVDQTAEWDADNTCDDGYGDSAGEWAFTRGGTPSEQNYDKITH